MSDFALIWQLCKIAYYVYWMFLLRAQQEQWRLRRNHVLLKKLKSHISISLFLHLNKREGIKYGFMVYSYKVIYIDEVKNVGYVNELWLFPNFIRF